MEAGPLLVFALTMFCHCESGVRNLCYRAQTKADFSPDEAGFEMTGGLRRERELW